jgi:hypothetical protein
MATVWTSSGGMTVGSPQQQALNRGKVVLSGGGGVSSRSSGNVSISGNTVFYNGQGYTVRPEDQASFIQNLTGGKGSSAAAAIAQAEARARELEKARLAEEKRRKEEQKRLEAERKASKEKAFSGTAAGQLQSQKMDKAQINVFDPGSKYTTTPYKQPLLTSLFSMGKGFLKDVSPFHGDGMSLRPGYTDYLELSEGLVRDERARVVMSPAKGTIQTDPFTGEEIVWKKTDPETGLDVLGTRGTTTRGDVQKSIDLERREEIVKLSSAFENRATSITSSYQEKVDSGELTYEEAEEGLDKEIKSLNKDYKKAQGQVYDKRKDTFSGFERSDTLRSSAKIGADLLATGASIGLGVVNPALGAGLGMAYFTGKGIALGTAKPTYEDIALSGGLFAGTGKNEEGKISILEPTELEAKFKQYRAEAGINLLIGGGYGKSFYKGFVENPILGEELKRLGDSKIVTGSVSIQRGKGSFDILKGVQRSGGLSREITIFGKVSSDGKEFIMKEGLGGATTAGRFNYNLYGGYSPTYYAGADVFVVGTKGSSIALNKGAGSLGKGVVLPKASFGAPFKKFSEEEGIRLANTLRLGGKREIFPFAGASKSLGKDAFGAEYFKTAGGKANVNVLEQSGLKGVKGYSLGNAKVNQFGIQKVVSNSIDDVSTFGFRGGGAGTKTIKGLSSPAVQRELLADVSKQISLTQAKNLPKPAMAGGSSSILNQRSVQRNIQQPSRNIVTQSLREMQKPKQDQALATSTQTMQRSASRYGSSSIQRQNILVSNKLLQSLTPAQATRTKGIQETLQQQLTRQSFLPKTPISSQFRLGLGMQSPPFGFIKPKAAQFGKSRRGAQRSLPSYIYQPSFTASALNIRAKRAPLLGGALSIRPILPRNKQKSLPKRAIVINSKSSPSEIRKYNARSKELSLKRFW